MNIYMLTGKGTVIARSPHNADTPAYRVVAYLDRMGHCTPDQVTDGTGVQNAAGLLAILRNKGIVQEVSGA